MKKKIKRYFFLDVDGTCTSIPGGYSKSFGNVIHKCMYCQYGYKNGTSFELGVLTKLTDGNNSQDSQDSQDAPDVPDAKENIDVQGLLSSFFQWCQKNGVELIPVTNNTKPTVLYFFEKLGIEIKEGSGNYRGGKSKITFINEFIDTIQDQQPNKDHEPTEYYYFEDSPQYFKNPHLFPDVKKVDCSHDNWIGNRLYHFQKKNKDIDYEKFIESLVP